MPEFLLRPLYCDCFDSIVLWFLLGGPLTPLVIAGSVIVRSIPLLDRLSKSADDLTLITGKGTLETFAECKPRKLSWLTADLAKALVRDVLMIGFDIDGLTRWMWSVGLLSRLKGLFIWSEIKKVFTFEPEAEPYLTCCYCCSLMMPSNVRNWLPYESFIVFIVLGLFSWSTPLACLLMLNLSLPADILFMCFYTLDSLNLFLNYRVKFFFEI